MNRRFCEGRSRVAALLALAVCCLAACSDDGRVKVHPVTGKVLYRGAPAAGAEVVFHSTLPRSEQKGLPIPRGVAGEGGEFQLTSFNPNDGAPAGDYEVTVVWPEPPPAGSDPEAAGDPIDRLGGQFANPTTSGLKATVTAGNNELEPFALE